MSWIPNLSVYVMRKIPVVAPTFAQLLKDIPEGSAQTRLFVQAAMDPPPDLEHLHWDALRYKTPPGEWTHREWWFVLKLGRMNRQVATGLAGTDETPFKFSLTDEVQSLLPKIDMRGTAATPTVLNSAATSAARKYQIEALMDEAFTSSKIEGAATTRPKAMKMLREESKPRDKSERMILNNYLAMERLVEVRDEPLSLDLMRELHAILTKDTLDDPSMEGTFRGPGDLIVIVDERQETIYEPPPHAQLHARLERLVAFANGTNDQPYIHPVIKAIILHFMIGYEHPFVDGNGRLARALCYWQLLRSGYWIARYVSISQAILKTKAKYYRAYLETETDENDLTYFIQYNLRGLVGEMERFEQLVEQSQRELDDLGKNVRRLKNLNLRQRDLVLHALKHPHFEYTITGHATAHAITHEGARKDLLELVELGLMERHAQRNPHQYVFYPDLMDRLLKMPEE